ncbi:MAG: DUF1330 domain-containing protein [Gammaproteobacteria bacterium]|nr:DUF1330 domain-containing protein [Gammaproteobacteria bacterium]MBT5202690.1 DUF1330 domain-containing protein [Gammaproteobacteria bacterium]MBT5603288.1 DUF1330 domain-containing protein [Gammaproteobacteria bacterium]MBT6244618.1 DUF1330 domain-containing protein [Gammaproteobacteria bacterium]
MSAYIVAHITISDWPTYRLYEAGFMDILRQYQGEICAADDNGEILEGPAQSTRTVILRFKDKASALSWYRSGAYQQLAEHRWKASDANIVIINGLDESG